MAVEGSETLATMEKVLKRRYEKRLEIAKQESDSVFQRVESDIGFGGWDHRVSMLTGDSQGDSADLGTAIDNQTSTTKEAFVVSRKKNFTTARLDSEAMFASEGAENSVINALDMAQDSALRTANKSLEIYFYGDGRGTRGNINATVTGTTLTLTVPTQSDNFDKGMKIQFADPAGAAGVLRDSGTELTIVSINHNTGAMVVTPSLTTVAGLTSGDDIVRSGTRDAVGNGLGAWIPYVRTGLGTAFNGVTRSDDPEMLAGLYYPGAGAQKLETLAKANTLLSRFDMPGSAKRVAVCHIDDYQDIALGLGSHMVTDSTQAKGWFGHNSVTIRTPRGDLPLVGSIRMRKGRFFILRPDTWQKRSLKKMPHIVDDDGKTLRVGERTDDVTWRLRAYYEFICRAPWANLHGDFAATS